MKKKDENESLESVKKHVSFNISEDKYSKYFLVNNELDLFLSTNKAIFNFSSLDEGTLIKIEKVINKFNLNLLNLMNRI